MQRLLFRLLAAALLLSALAFAQKRYTGPRPETPDVPYLLMAGKLTSTEVATAKESTEKEGTAYTVTGATSPARTPVAEPIMLFQADKLNPDRLTLYRMDVRTGNRVVILPGLGAKRKKDAARPIFLMVTTLAPGLFKVEVNEMLADGEYCLSPEGSNQAFCFTAY